MALLTVDAVLGRLEQVKPAGRGQWTALCPAHDDHNPSLSVTTGDDGRLLLHCFAGCEFDAILAAIGQPGVSSNGHGPGSKNGQGPVRQQVVATYDYQAEDGRLVYRKLRYGPVKSFAWQHPAEGGKWAKGRGGDAEPILYHLPALAQTERFDRVYVVEGEKDADKLEALGLTAVCNPGGAAEKWRLEWTRYFAGRIVYVIPDNDEPGRRHAGDVAANLEPVAQIVKVIALPGLPVGGDVSDYLDAGHTLDDLEQTCLMAPRWQPGQVEEGKEPEQPAILETGANPLAGLRVVNLAELQAADLPPLEFLVDGFLARGHFGVLASKAKTGKTWFCLQLAQAIDTGRPMLGRETRKGKVLYIALEDGERRVRDRSIALDWKAQQARFLFTLDYLDGNNGGKGPGIVQLAALAPDYDLVILDTLAAARSGKQSENENLAAARIAYDLADVAHSSGAAILVTHHLSKMPTADPFEQLRGASSLRAGYDLGLVIQREHGEREALLHTEGRDVGGESFTLRQADGGAGWELLGSGAELLKLRAGKKVFQTLLDIGDGATLDDIAKAAGIARQSAHAQLIRLEERGLVRRDRPEQMELIEGTKLPKKGADRWYVISA